MVGRKRGFRKSSIRCWQAAVTADFSVAEKPVDLMCLLGSCRSRLRLLPLRGGASVWQAHLSRLGSPRRLKCTTTRRARGPAIFLSGLSMRPQAAGEGGILRRQMGALLWPIWNFLRMATLRRGGAAMHLHVYRDESRSGHLDLVCGGDHPWTIDLVAVTVAAILVVGFAGALATLWIR